jgi:IS30 family transposase
MVKYTKDDRDEIIKLYEKGFNTVEISRKTMKSQSGIERLLKRNNLFKKQKKITLIHL